MLLDLGSIEYTVRLLTGHCVTRMSSPTKQKSIDVTIDYVPVVGHHPQLKRWSTESSLPVPSSTRLDDRQQPQRVKRSWGWCCLR
jgi:hypothetical protein